MRLMLLSPTEVGALVWVFITALVGLVSRLPLPLSDFFSRVQSRANKKDVLVTRPSGGTSKRPCKNATDTPGWALCQQRCLAIDNLDDFRGQQPKLREMDYVVGVVSDCWCVCGCGCDERIPRDLICPAGVRTDSCYETEAPSLQGKTPAVEIPEWENMGIYLTPVSSKMARFWAKKRQGHLMEIIYFNG